MFNEITNNNSAEIGMSKKIVKPLKIAFVMHPWTGITEAGAIGIITAQLAKRFCAENKVLILSGRFRKKHKFIKSENLEYIEVPIQLDRQFVKFFTYLDKSDLFHSRKRPFFVSPLYYLEYALKVGIQLKREKCDIIHVHSMSQFVPIIKKLNPKAKIVLHMHADWLTMVDHKLNDKRLPFTDLILSCSDYMTQKIKSQFPAYANRCKTLFNGVDIQAFSGTRKNNANETGCAKKILFVGRISPEKGIHVLIEAFKKLVSDFPEAELHLIGPKNPLPPQYIVTLSDEEKVQGLSKFYNGNSYLSYLQRLIPRSLKNKIIFHDAVSRDKIVNYYLEADVLINPSYYETFGMSLVEAMSLQVPVIASKVGGMTEVIGDSDAGLLVESGNIDELAQAIASLLNDKDRNVKMGLNGRKRAEEMFSWDKIASDLMENYKRLYN